MSETRERRVRHAAARQGLRLQKSRIRTPEHHHRGTYGLVDVGTGYLAVGDVNTGCGLSLDDIEKALAE